MLVPALVLAALAAAPSVGAQDGAVTVRILGAQDGKGTFSAKGALSDHGTVRRTRSAATLRFAAKGLNGTITFVVTTKAKPATWKIAAGTKAYNGLYGHGTMKTNASGSVVTLTGTVARPRQPT